MLLPTPISTAISVVQWHEISLSVQEELTDGFRLFRADVQQFIQQHTSPELLQELKDNRDGQTGPLARELRRNVAEKGWLAMSWPREHGGLDGSHIDQFIVEEEFVRANIGGGLSATFAQAAAIMAAGTEE